MLRAILILILISISFASRYTISEYPWIKVCRVREKHCINNYDQEVLLAYYKHLYSGCTHIFGNLVLCGLQRYENGSDPDLSFLGSIMEVSGYVYISRCSIRTIHLRSLRVVRGEPPYVIQGVKASIVLEGNNHNITHGLEILNLGNLSVIQNHNVFMRNNILLCHIAFTIDWNQLLLDPDNQKFLPDRTEDVQSQKLCDFGLRKRDESEYQTVNSCDGSCPMVNSKGLCWGPGPELCQKMFKCKDDLKTYCLDGIRSNQRCQDECLGGCEGQPGNCRACANAMNDGRCVPQCPPRTIVNRTNSRTEPNPDFKYNFHDICVKDCPPQFLKSESYCVIECDLTSQIPVNGTCQKCPDDGCPKHCTEEAIFGGTSLNYLDATSLKKFESCVYYTGALFINQLSFEPRMPNPIRDHRLFWNLHKLRQIVGYVYFDLKDAPGELKNLSFLENVESIVMEVKQHTPGSALSLLNGKHIEFLGLRSLKNIGGGAYLHNFSNLCYLSGLTSLVPSRMKLVQSEADCERRGRVCASECLPQAGCWGPGEDMCAHCCNLQAGRHCVSKCSDRMGYYEANQSSALFTGNSQSLCRTLPLHEANLSALSREDVRAAIVPAKKCSPCHPECAATCYGPGPDNCQGGCKHFQHGEECVPQCPPETFVDQTSKRCLRCHKICLHPHVSVGGRLCSGPGAFFGAGGCTSCWTVLKNATTQRYDCLAKDCPAKHFTESYRTYDFIVKHRLEVSNETASTVGSKGEAGGMLRVCKPCHPFCDICTANGTHASICHKCIHWWFKSECVEECPPTETYSPPSTKTTTEPLTTGSLQRPVNPVTVPGQPQLNGSLANYSQDDPKRTSMLRLAKQKHCLLCHEECFQGCSGPGPDTCVKCRNFKIILSTQPEKFICNSSCPPERPHVLHRMCLTAKQHEKLSGETANKRRNHIIIGVSACVIVIILLMVVLLICCMKRRAEMERMREKLRSAYTNLLEPDQDKVQQNQQGLREPNMGRLEMINADDLDYDLLAPPLGCGAFGVVYKGLWRVPKAALLKHGYHGRAQLDVAIKVIQNDYPMSPGLFNSALGENNSASKDAETEAKRAIARAKMEELLQEAKVMASVEYRFCLPLIGICLSRERHCLVSAFVELGSLDKYVKEYQKELDSLTMLTWAEQIADGMSYLEMRGIIHRDLAARNVLVQRRDLVQITDFGLAKMLERKDEESVVVHAGRVPIRWLAIETLQDSIYSHKTDVWTYGVTLWEIFTYGRRPYEEVETKDIKDHVMKGGRLSQPEICTLDVYMVMVKCWMEDYESRPTFVELKRIFGAFCKTPGRYLYIQGDVYAINYPTSSFLTSNASTEPHELQPLLPSSTEETKPNGNLRWTAKTPGQVGSVSQSSMAPLASREDSWLTELPESPKFPSTFSNSSHLTDSTKKTMDPSSKASWMSQPITDAYLEPKPAMRNQSFQSQNTDDVSDGADYLTPKSTLPGPNKPSTEPLGVDNEQYFGKPLS